MAEGKAKVKASAGLNVRKGAGTNYAKIGGLTNGTIVTYYGENNGWLQIKYNGQTGWISKQYTSITQAATSGSSGNAGKSSSGSVQVTCDVLNVRKGNGTGYGIIGTLSRGKVVSYSEEKGGWLKISYNGQTGWISKQYTKASSSGGNSSSNKGNSSGSYTLYVNTEVLNVRAGAGTGNAKIGTVSYGTKLTAVEDKNGWARIKYGSGYGWVCKQYTSSKAPSSGGGGGGTSTGGAKADQALANKSVQVANEMHSTGWCAKGVSTAVSRTHGFYPGGNGNTIGNGLIASGRYKKIDISLANALKIPGLIFSWQRTSTKLGAIYGHTAISQGNGKSSTCDYYENNTLASSGGRSGLKVYSLK